MNTRRNRNFYDRHQYANKKDDLAFSLCGDFQFVIPAKHVPVKTGRGLEPAPAEAEDEGEACIKTMSNPIPAPIGDTNLHPLLTARRRLVNIEAYSAKAGYSQHVLIIKPSFPRKRESSAIIGMLELHYQHI